MGACFQAPRAAPRQRLMEMHHALTNQAYISGCFSDKLHMYVQMR